MLRRTYALVTVALALFVLAVTDAGASVKRTFVASGGLAANVAFNCSIANPCRRFSEALGVTAPNGEVIVLDSAGYGAVTIAQSVSIIAPAGVYAGVSVFSGDGITVNGAGIKVILRGLTVNGQGGTNGIVYTQGSNLHVENCVVSGMSGYGLTSTATNSNLMVVDTLIRENGLAGVYLTNAMLATFERVQIKHNDGAGLYALNGPIVSIKDATISHNNVDGLAAATLNVAGYTKLLVENSQVVFNAESGVYVITNGGPNARAVVTIQGSNLSNNGVAGIYAGAIGAVWIAARNNIIDNNSSGIVIEDNSIVTIADNLIHDNVQDGVFINDSSSTGLLSGNTITRNGGAGIKTGSVNVQTLNNNAVTFNNPDLTGTLNTLFPK